MRTSNESRQLIFDSLRSALPQQISSDDTEAIESIPSHKATQKNVDAFTQQLESAKAEVHHIESKDLGKSLVSIISSGEFKSILTEDVENLNRLMVNVSKKTNTKIIKFDRVLENIKDRVFDADASVSYAQYGIAETGTLVVTSSPTRARSLSLVTPAHICIIPEKVIFRNLSIVLKKSRMNQNMPTNLVLISGPSRTADIEFNISLGIHGPKRLIVLILKS